MFSPDLTRRGLPRLAALATVAVLCALGPAPAVRPAAAAVPGGEPVFSNPLEITNGFFPVVPGTVKVYSGRDDGARVTIVETHLPEPRGFEWGGQVVPCRVVRSLRFRSGALIEREHRFFAQADDGAVYKWGDTDEEDDDGEADDDDEPGGWIVGTRAAMDPPDVVEGNAPVLYMPAVPERGDSWSVDQVAPWFLTTFTVRGVVSRVRVRVGRFRDCLCVRTEDVRDGEVGIVWFAPGLGPVKSRGPGERLKLQASTIRAR